MYTRMNQRGFSLIELSIVLVILGLLVGGILAGQSLIRASELRAVGSEYSRYRTAVNAFRDKYFAIPGDLTNATAFWGVATACPGSSTQGTTTTTCDGNGNGVLDNSVSGPTNPGNEMFRFWQHLANAGMIEGVYSGVTGGVSNIYTAKIGTNIPASKLNGAGWGANNAGVATTSAPGYLFEGDYTAVYWFGAEMANNNPGTPVLRPEEAWNIDTKLDDGKPGVGLIRTFEDRVLCYDGAASSSAQATTVNYRLSETSIACPLNFRI